jgi:meso-butanediol dehydrogenase/(S,S)-butanediol dehydrogenase/diacetyl reductase
LRSERGWIILIAKAPGEKSMTGRLAGKVAVVTAGGSGIGAATARRFAREKASVIIADLSGTRAAEVAGAITQEGGNARWLKMDASDPEGVQAAIRLAVDSWGRLDVMFNNAGMGTVEPLEAITLETWNRILAVTLTSVCLGIKYSLAIMRKQGAGSIVNTASISGPAGDYGMSAYNAAKAGVINLARAAALENAKYGIRINCVCPGAIDTRVSQLLGGNDVEGFRRKLGQNPIGRIGEPEEIANAVLFVASDEASFITGTTIVVDGGLTTHTGLPHFI